MRVACVLIPHFPVALERRDRPDLRGLPVVIGGAPGERKAVLDCSAEARRRGVQPEMPLRQALALCRDAVFIDPRPAVYRAAFAAILDTLERFSPRVQPLAPGRALLDLTGTEQLWPDETALAVAIHDAVRAVCALVPRVGIADGPFAAQCAAAVTGSGQGGSAREACARWEGPPCLPPTAQGGSAGGDPPCATGGKRAERAGGWLRRAAVDIHGRADPPVSPLLRRGDRLDLISASAQGDRPDLIPPVQQGGSERSEQGGGAPGGSTGGGSSRRRLDTDAGSGNAAYPYDPQRSPEPSAVPPAAHCPLATAHCPLATGHWPLPTARSVHPRVVPPGTTPTFLARLPVELLPAPAEMRRRLHLLGLHRLGDLAALPFGAVQAQFGPEGARAWRLVSGIDEGRVLPRRNAEEPEETLDLPAPTADRAVIERAIEVLVGRLLRRPEAGNHLVRRATLRINLEDGRAWERTHTFREAASGPRALLVGLRTRLEGMELPAAAVAVSLTLHDLAGERAHQGTLFSARAHRRAQINEAVARLRASQGGAPVLRAVEVEPWSRIPERQAALTEYEA